jgi:hypothetical protein
MSKTITQAWTNFKATVDGKDLILQCQETVRDSGTYYDLWAQEADTTYECRIIKADPVIDPSDQKDFEDNYSAHVNKPVPVRTDPVGVERWRLQGYGVFGTCTAGNTQEADFTLPEDLHIKGASLCAPVGEMGDWIEGHVVHPNGSTVVATFIHQWFICYAGLLEVETPMASEIPAGFIIRVIYHSTGDTDVPFSSNFKLYKKL